MCHALTQTIGTIKTFKKYKSTADKFFAGKTQKVVSNGEIAVTKFKQLNQRYPASTTHILPNF